MLRLLLISLIVAGCNNNDTIQQTGYGHEMYNSPDSVVYPVDYTGNLQLVAPKGWRIHCYWEKDWMGPGWRGHTHFSPVNIICLSIIDDEVPALEHELLHAECDCYCVEGHLEEERCK